MKANISQLPEWAKKPLRGFRNALKEAMPHSQTNNKHHINILQTKPKHEDVVNIYTIMLGRPPEDESVIEDHLNSAGTIHKLITIFANSQEFADVIGRHVNCMRRSGQSLENGSSITGHLNSIQTARELIKLFVNSPEFADSSPNHEDVANAYRLVLNRSPENELAVKRHLNSAPTIRELLKTFVNAPEFDSLIERDIESVPSPFFHFNTTIDVKGIVKSYINHKRQPLAEHNVNFLGVAVPIKVMDHLADKGGQLDHIPIPANYHADMAEWAAALRAVDLAQKEFTMIELGCGWACWMNNTGVAAKARKLPIHLIGIEGDDSLLEIAREALKVNNFSADEYTLKQGIAAPRSGYALFPRLQNDDRWGAEPIFDVSESDSKKAIATGKFDRLRMVPLSEAIGDRKKIDLVHMDIQGGEADFVDQSIELLSEKVGYLVIGTHSRSIEGKLFDVLLSNGWLLEVERPAIFQIVNGQPITQVDGIQGWKNPKFHKKSS